MNKQLGGGGGGGGGGESWYTVNHDISAIKRHGCYLFHHVI